MTGNDDGRDEELEALMDVPEIDTAKITTQLNTRKGIKAETPPAGTPPPKVDPPKTEPPKAEPPKVEVPDPDKLVGDRLKEIFGDRYTGLDELKKADIPAKLQELETLRQRNQALETQLKTKPKHPFANDDIAKFNEFVRETGIKDAGVFNRINATDIANMADMDALVMQHIVDNPSLAGKEPQVQRYFERKYNVDPKKVEEGDITQEELEINQIGVASEGAKAKAKLLELKGKIKMPPEPLADESPEAKTKWTPEIEAKQKSAWTKVNETIGEQYSKLPIYIKGSKEPIINFVLPEESKKTILTTALDFVVSNQMEVNEANVRSVATQMYSDAILTNMEEITHAVFERARSMTEDEYLKIYHNPSGKNEDKPPSGGEPESDEAKREKAFNAEMDR